MLAELTRKRTGWKSAINAVARTVTDLVLPPQCVHCRAITRDTGALCSDCWSSMTFIDAPLCDRLGVPFAYDPGDGVVSAGALAKPPEWNRARACVVFDDVARDLIHALKYHDRHEVCGLMARAGAELLRDAEYLIPVPLHPVHLWKRRYNQAALLGHAISKLSGVACESELLLRSRVTRQQAGLKADARRKNVERAFAVNAERSSEIVNRRVLLVDDVRTTGSTANACAKTLLRAGCEQVDVLTFSLVNSQTRLHI